MRIRTEDESLLTARVQDALRGTSLHGRPHFVGFLDVHQAELARAAAAHAGVPAMCWGGYADAQRVVFGAFPDGQEPDSAAFPVTALEVCFRRGIKLTHRDFLGSLMALGVERDTIGDLLLEDGRAVLFVRRELAGHLAAGLDRVGREGVRTALTDAPLLPPPRPLIPISTTIASARLDCIVTALARCGRSEAAQTISRGLVARNGQVCTEVSDTVNEGDILVLRGEGKFVIQALGPLTKKQRLTFRAGKYS